jgi:hypothetical protein
LRQRKVAGLAYDREHGKLSNKTKQALDVIKAKIKKLFRSSEWSPIRASKAARRGRREADLPPLGVNNARSRSLPAIFQTFSGNGVLRGSPIGTSQKYAVANLRLAPSVLCLASYGNGPER